MNSKGYGHCASNKNTLRSYCSYAYGLFLHQGNYSRSRVLQIWSVPHQHNVAHNRVLHLLDAHGANSLMEHLQVVT